MRGTTDPLIMQRAFQCWGNVRQEGAHIDVDQHHTVVSRPGPCSDHTMSFIATSLPVQPRYQLASKRSSLRAEKKAATTCSSECSTHYDPQLIHKHATPCLEIKFIIHAKTIITGLLYILTSLPSHAAYQKHLHAYHHDSDWVVLHHSCLSFHSLADTKALAEIHQQSALTSHSATQSGHVDPYRPWSQSEPMLLLCHELACRCLLLVLKMEP